MTSPNWGLAGGGQFQNALATGLQFGQMARQRQEDAERKNALAAYAANPDDPKSTEALIKADPRLGVQVMEKQRERQAEAQLGQLTQAAMSGDPAAMKQLASANFDRWKALDTNQRAAAKQEAEIFGNAAMDILNRPAEQRGPALQAYAQQLGQQYPEVAQLLQMPPEQQEMALRSAVAEAGMVKQLIEMEQPRYQAIPEGGTLVDTRNPQAVQSYMSGLNQGPQPGVVEDGYRFKGGNPADPSAWEPVGQGGPTQPASATFRP